MGGAGGTSTGLGTESSSLGPLCSVQHKEEEEFTMLVFASVVLK